MYQKIMWGGFIADKLDIREIDDGWGGWGQQRRRAPALFTNRKAAREQYQDVRKVDLTELLTR